MRSQLRIFWTALMFYSRLPVPKGIDHNAKDLNKATRYFPLIGLLIGLIGTLIYIPTNLFLFHELAILLAMATTVYVTGAFHEDGFMDVCDGFGGGWTKEQKLNIMKDSRVGSYGTIGMILLVIAKFTILSKLSEQQFIFTFILSHALSRLVPVWIIQFSTYVRDDQKEKAKPVAEKINATNIFIASLLTTGSIITLGLNALVILLFVPILFIISRAYFKKHLGGYTGDCLGASQQVSEFIFYILFFISWKFGLLGIPVWV